MMVIDVPVASYSSPARIRDWIRQLELAREDEDAEPFDLMAINDYLEMARGWLENQGAAAAADTGSAA
jgi:TorA maturation chaperone TorD